MTENTLPSRQIGLIVKNKDGSVQRALFPCPSTVNTAAETYDDMPMLSPITSDGSLVPPRTPGGSLVPPRTFDGSLVPPRTPGGSLVPPRTFDGSLVPPRTPDGSLVPPRTFDGSLVPPRTPDGSLVPPRTFDGGCRFSSRSSLDGRLSSLPPAQSSSGCLPPMLPLSPSSRSLSSDPLVTPTFKRPAVFSKSSSGVLIKAKPVGGGASTFLTTPSRNGALREASAEIARLKTALDVAKAEMEQLKYGHSIDMATRDQQIVKLKSKLEESRNNVILTRKRELRAKAAVDGLREAASAAEREQTLGFRKSYDCLQDARTRRARFSPLKDLVFELCVTSDPSVVSAFLADFVNFMNGTDVEPPPKFSASQSLVFKQKFDISYAKYRKMKGMLHDVCGFKVLASVRQLQKEANKHSTKSLYSVSSALDADQKPVPIIELNDLRGRLESRLQALADSNQLLTGDEYGGKIWLCVIADKGGQDTKLGVMIANVESTNSFYNITLCGAYRGEDKQSSLVKYLPSVIDEIYNLTHLSYECDGQVITTEICWFLTGDFAFLFSCFGHKGATATHDCLFCTDRKCKDISAWNPDLPSTSRSVDSFAADSVTGGHGVYQNSNVLFPKIPLENVVRPSLHIFMGIADFSFDALEAAASQFDSNNVVVGGSFVSKRTQKSQLAGLRKDLKHEFSVLQTLKSDLKRSELVHTVFLAIENSLIEPSKSGLAKERRCMAGANCVMRDRRAYEIDRRMWDVCSLCKGDVHFECAGQVSAETDMRATLNGCVCFDCENVSLNQRVKYVSNEVEDLRRCLLQSEAAHAKLQNDVNMLNSALNEGTGPKARELDNKYRECGGDRSAYHQKFTGNHTMKLLRRGNAAALWSIFPDSHEKTHFIKYMESLGELQSFAHSGFLTASEIDRMRELIPEMLGHLKEANPKLSVTAKLHCMVKHVLEFVERTKTWGKMSEQAIESLHAHMNHLNSRFAGVRNPQSRYHAMSDAMAFGNHLFDIGEL